MILRPPNRSQPVPLPGHSVQPPGTPWHGPILNSFPPALSRSCAAPALSAALPGAPSACPPRHHLSITPTNSSGNFPLINPFENHEKEGSIRLTARASDGS
ncbi:MAG: hypothetical protein LBM04_03845 [Opitutaceae bacterium]|nr:hypothetical protein [Opitutaceae bacterium]